MIYIHIYVHVMMDKYVYIYHVQFVCLYIIIHFRITGSRRESLQVLQATAIGTSHDWEWLGYHTTYILMVMTGGW